jgi:hypothetical protein
VQLDSARKTVDGVDGRCLDARARIRLLDHGAKQARSASTRSTVLMRTSSAADMAASLMTHLDADFIGEPESPTVASSTSRSAPAVHECRGSCRPDAGQNNQYAIVMRASY